MTSVTDILLDAFGRVRESVPGVVDGLTVPQLLYRPDEGGNHIAWLVWHLTRVQDDHLAGVAERVGVSASEQVWFSQGWRERFDLPYPARAIGYGQTAEDVAAFRLVDPELLVGYHLAVQEETSRIVSAMRDEDFDRVVDERWNPPVTAAVRIVSVVNDTTQHVGQAAFLRGLIDRGAA